MEEFNNGGFVPYNTFLSFNDTTFVPAGKIIDFEVTHAVDSTLIKDHPDEMEQYIRLKLAREIANKLIEEDLIRIDTNEDIDSMTTNVRAKIKVIQE